MKQQLISNQIVNEKIIIHDPKIDEYHEVCTRKLFSIFHVNNELTLPCIKWKISEFVPSYAFLYVLNDFKDELSIFCEEVLKHYLFSEKKTSLVFTNNLFFSFKTNPSKVLEFKEICLKIEQEDQLYYLKKNKIKISDDLYSGLRFPNYLDEFLKIKGARVNLNSSILYEAINRLIIKFPSKVDKKIFSDLQQFLILAADSFTKQHSLNYVLKIVLTYYFFKKEIEHKAKAYPLQKHIKVKISNAKLYFAFGNKDVLGIFLALNLEADTERFGKKHILVILKQLLCNYVFIENSFFSFQLGSLNFIYLELRKKDGHKSQNLNGIVKKLTIEIKNSIETISSRVISYRNEEEIYRNIILLKDQLQNAKDLPQVVISFCEHDGKNLKFHAIVLRLISNKKTDLKNKIFKLSSKASIYVEKTIDLEPLGDKSIKEAKIIRLTFPSSQFTRKDHSIDLLKARNFVSTCITELVGEFRDFNGGYIDQQRKNFYKLKQLLEKQDFQNEIHIENLFYSLTPVTVQASFSAEHLKKLFLFFLQSLSMEIPLEKNTLTLIDNNEVGVYIFIKSKSIDLKKSFFPIIDENFFDPLNFASASIEIDGYLYLGFIFLHPEDPEGFIKKINEIKKNYFQNKEIEQTLCINLPRSNHSLDPRIDSDRHSGVLIKMLYEGLTRIGPNNKPMLAVADRVTISEDKKTYIFHLKDSYWSNNEPILAKDFEYAWKKILDPNFYTNHAFMFYAIKNAEAIKNSKKDFKELGVSSINEKTLKVELEYPTPYFLSLTAHWIYSPLCKKICRSDPGWAYFGENEYVSNGPFKVDTWERGKEIILVKNPTYWDASSVKLKKIRALNIDDEEILLSMFSKGQIHWLGEPLSLIPSKILSAKDHRTNIKSHRTSALFWLMLNVKSFPVKSKFIRRALAYSLNRKLIIENVLGNKASIATQISKNFEFLSNDRVFKDADFQMARKYFELGLQEMKLDKENFPSLTLTFSPSEQYEELFIEIVRQWKEILGIDVALKRVSVLQLRDHLKNNDFQVSGYTHYSWSDDPIYHFDLLKGPEYGFNGTQWSNPLFLSLIEKTKKEIDSIKREAIIIQLENIVLNEMPIIPIYFYNYRFVQSKLLKKVVLSNIGQIDFKYGELK